MCAAGYYGTATDGNADNCSPCRIGTWNAMVDMMHDSACMDCSGSKTTENNGTASSDLCGKFLKFTYTHMPTIRVNLLTFYLSIFAKTLNRP